MQNLITPALEISNQSSEITTAKSSRIEPNAFLNNENLEIKTTRIDKAENSNLPQTEADLHKQFLILGRERHKLTYKLLALLPEIYRQKIYEKHGFSTIYEYAGKLAVLSHSTVEKALKLEQKLKDKPLLQKAIETCGVHKVAIVANLATPETEQMFVDKIENMSKPALQQLSKELRGKIQTSWQIEMDEEMMKTFLKLKKNLGKFGSELSNKEAMRRILKKFEEVSDENNEKKGKSELGKESKTMMVKMPKPQTQACLPTGMAETSTKILGDFSKSGKFVSLKKLCRNFEHHACEKFARAITHDRANLATFFERTQACRYIPIAKKREVLTPTNGFCAHPNCQNPAQIFHHPKRFFQLKSHESVIPLCKIHHEFAHNGITENPTDHTQIQADTLYRKYRQESLL